ncbi:outer membrane protein assembly factor BamA [Pseudosulfitobacter sp. DSM 107133]|uniref:outer membrane protein assembly factor BamA n=1 Tax=Pseudosulfitobacter sp. DSM 107133 TaxID=2883100 RepID=UPI000DF1BEB3|nr:outer membrane protein assembly factor BamA [Pseudosulfitobacter sp. DSM 107133]UOA27470.1 Outer membrane protein assembly factor BamA [Pseudosulfitobacter sp. DSM 107133]
MRLGIEGGEAKRQGRGYIAAGFLQAFGFLAVTATGYTFYATEAQAQTYRFDRVVIEGNARIGQSAILSQAGIARGQTLSAGQLNDAYQRLQSSGLFESVAIAPQGNTLRITVVELPTINRISFEGNRRIKDDALTALVSSSERRVFSPGLAEKDAAAISEAYSNEGRLAARVTPRVIKRRDNRVDLVFEIFEGDVVEVERLSFVGNRVFSDRRLRRVLGTKQAGLFRALIRADTFVADRIEFDKQMLRDFYLSRGYVDFRVNSVNAELTKERDGYFLVFNVQEGQQFKFGQVTTVSEMPGVDADEYQAVTKIRPGVVYSPALVEQEISRMEALAIRNTVDFMRVEPRITRNDRDQTLDVEFVISRGPRVFVERIDIEGNTTTLDRVLRRQFPVAEGDPFNPREIRESAERIRALDYFENAEVNAREGSSPEQVIVDVDVVEKPTGSLSFGGTFSSDNGFGLAVSFVERNFVGRGQSLKLDFSTAEEAETYGITFGEPALLGRDLAFGFKLQYGTTNSDANSFDTEQIIFQPSLAFPLSENGRLQVRYTAEAIDVLARDTNESGAVITGDIAAGEQFRSSIGYTYSYDTRRSGLDPTAGVLLEFGQDFAGLGGDSEYIRTTAKIVGQKTILNDEVTLTATLEGGALSWLGGTNRKVDRFVLGPSLMRGFEAGGIGPRDQSNGFDNSLGGNLYLTARFEAEFPLGLPEEYGIRGAVFYDVGNLWDLSDVNLAGGTVVGESGSFRHVLGFSILWDTPIGPLRFNFTDAIKKEAFDRDQSFDLTLSTTF